MTKTVLMGALILVAVMAGCNKSEGVKVSDTVTPPDMTRQLEQADKDKAILEKQNADLQKAIGILDKKVQFTNRLCLVLATIAAIALLTHAVVRKYAWLAVKSLYRLIVKWMPSLIAWLFSLAVKLVRFIKSKIIRKKDGNISSVI